MCGIVTSCIAGQKLPASVAVTASLLTEVLTVLDIILATFFLALPLNMQSSSLKIIYFRFVKILIFNMPNEVSKNSTTFFIFHHWLHFCCQVNAVNVEAESMEKIKELVGKDPKCLTIMLLDHRVHAGRYLEECQLFVGGS